MHDLNKLLYSIWGPNCLSLKDKSHFFLNYRSHDGFHEDEDGYLVADNEKYATQRKVFDDLGQGVLKNAFEGKRIVIIRHLGYLFYGHVYFLNELHILTIRPTWN